MTTHARITITAAITSALGILPLFLLVDEQDWIVPALIAVAMVFGLGYLIRRSRAPRLIAAPSQLVALILWLGVISASDVAFLGFLPNGAWVERMIATFDNANTVIFEYAAPVPVTSGITAAVVGGAGVVAILIDFLVLEIDRVALTVAPLATCYIVTSAALDQSLEWYWFLPPAAGYLLLLVSVARTRMAAWGRTITATGRRHGIPSTDSMARSGRRVGITALVIAITVPAAVPMLSYGLIGTGGSGDGGRVIRTDNPMLDMRRNLQQDAPNTRILRYTSEENEGARMKFATLDVFTMEGWNLSQREVPSSQNVAGGLPQPVGLNTAGLETSQYEITVEDWGYWCPDGGARSCWLPMPYPPADIDIDGGWIFDTATLDVIYTDEGAPADEPYSVGAYQLDLDYDTLNASASPSSDVEDTLELPDDFPDLVAQEADRVVAEAEAESQVEMAAALQSWFRSSAFTYSVEQVAGNSSDAMVDFLNDRSGYCEQFATTMAAMARHLGIPSRVALGFTSGELQGDNSYQVRAKDMHAWPELYFEGVGWVPFEPTPSTRTGSAPDWTRPEVDVPTTEPDGPSSEPSAPAATPSGGPVEMPEDDIASGIGSDSDSGLGTAVLVALIILAVSAVVLAPRAIGVLRRRRRWEGSAGDPIALAETAWTDVRYAVEDARLPWDEAATPRMIGRSVIGAARLDRSDAEQVGVVVEAVERARYSAFPRVPDDLEATARSLSATIVDSRGRGAQWRARYWSRWFTSVVEPVSRAIMRWSQWSTSVGDHSGDAVARRSRSQ